MADSGDFGERDADERLRRELMESLTDEDWAAARAGFGDPELATE